MYTDIDTDYEVQFTYLAELEGDGVWVVARGQLEVLDRRQQDAPVEVERGLAAARVRVRMRVSRG